MLKLAQSTTKIMDGCALYECMMGLCILSASSARKLLGLLVGLVIDDR